MPHRVCDFLRGASPAAGGPFHKRRQHTRNSSSTSVATTASSSSSSSSTTAALHSISRNDQSSSTRNSRRSSSSTSSTSSTSSHHNSNNSTLPTSTSTTPPPPPPPTPSPSADDDDQNNSRNHQIPHKKHSRRRHQHNHRNHHNHYRLAIKLPDALTRALHQYHLRLPCDSLTSLSSLTSRTRRSLCQYICPHASGAAALLALSSSSSPSSSQPHLKLGWRIESPPAVFHGLPENCSGALVSGQIVVDVNHDAVRVASLVASLTLRITHKRPRVKDCEACRHHTTLLEEWRLIAPPRLQPSTMSISTPADDSTTEHPRPPAALSKGRHLFPFSILLDGSLPASLDCPLLSISYDFAVKAIVVGKKGDSCATIGTNGTLLVKRSIPQPLYPHASIRIFPPISIRIVANYSPVMHPTGSNTMSLRIEGLLGPDEDRPGWQRLYRLRRVSWKLVETMTTLAAACNGHQQQPPRTPPSSSRPSPSLVSSSSSSSSSSLENSSASDQGSDSTPHSPQPASPTPRESARQEEEHGSRRGVERRSTRVVGRRELLRGWKTSITSSSSQGSSNTCDTDTAGAASSTVELDLSYGITHQHQHHHHHAGTTAPYACDVCTREGAISISHSLELELIVSRESLPEGRPERAVPGGRGRVLSASYAVVLTECPGMGVSWDREAPPVYQDVPPSPPPYGGNVGDYGPLPPSPQASPQEEGEPLMTTPLRGEGLPPDTAG